MSRSCSCSCSAPSDYLNGKDPTLRAIAHFEMELARIAGVHDAKMLKSDPAFALASLFGKLPLSRAPLLKALRVQPVILSRADGRRISR